MSASRRHLHITSDKEKIEDIGSCAALCLCRAHVQDSTLIAVNARGPRCRFHLQCLCFVTGGAMHALWTPHTLSQLGAGRLMVFSHPKQSSSVVKLETANRGIRVRCPIQGTLRVHGCSQNQTRYDRERCQISPPASIMQGPTEGSWTPRAVARNAPEGPRRLAKPSPCSLRHNKRHESVSSD